MLFVAVFNLTFAQNPSQPPPPPAWYVGFSMASVKIIAGGTLSASFSVETDSSLNPSFTFTFSSGQDFININCCVNSNPGSACYSGNENSLCVSSIIRDEYKTSIIPD